MITTDSSPFDKTNHYALTYNKMIQNINDELKSNPEDCKKLREFKMKILLIIEKGLADANPERS